MAFYDIDLDWLASFMFLFFFSGALVLNKSYDYVTLMHPVRRILVWNSDSLIPSLRLELERWIGCVDASFLLFLYMSIIRLASSFGAIGM